MAETLIMVAGDLVSVASALAEQALAPEREVLVVVSDEETREAIEERVEVPGDETLLRFREWGESAGKPQYDRVLMVGIPDRDDRAKCVQYALGRLKEGGDAFQLLRAR